MNPAVAGFRPVARAPHPNASRAFGGNRAGCGLATRKRSRAASGACTRRRARRATSTGSPATRWPARARACAARPGRSATVPRAACGGPGAHEGWARVHKVHRASLCPVVPGH
eukprot:4391435-Prymnesium_polylepis.1